jgi:hypothetical protein
MFLSCVQWRYEAVLGDVVYVLEFFLTLMTLAADGHK